MIIYFDTETTGLRPGQIAQLSYVVQTKEKTVGKNFFFAVDSMDYGAFMVHGFSVKKLLELSSGKRFSDCFIEINNDFSSAHTICSHNTAFDFMFMHAEYGRMGKDFIVNNDFCTMKSLTPVCKLKRSSGAYKYPKLSEACAFFGITDTEIKQSVNMIFGVDAGFHDARFDTAAVFLICNRAMSTYEDFKVLEGDL